LIKLKEHYGDLPLKIVLDNARYQHCEFVENAAKKLKYYAFIFYLHIRQI